jgi:hypothetical protein
MTQKKMSMAEVMSFSIGANLLLVGAILFFKDLI